MRDLRLLAELLSLLDGLDDHGVFADFFGGNPDSYYEERFDADDWLGSPKRPEAAA